MEKLKFYPFGPKLYNKLIITYPQLSTLMFSINKVHMNNIKTINKINQGGRTVPGVNIPQQGYNPHMMMTGHHMNHPNMAPMFNHNMNQINISPIKNQHIGYNNPPMNNNNPQQHYNMMIGSNLGNMINPLISMGINQYNSNSIKNKPLNNEQSAERRKKNIKYYK
jgi:hypothetical protein